MTTESTKKNGIATLTLGAIGVVYGDIGTSPLYTMKEVFSPAHGIAVSPANVIGVVSLILWCLIVVISLKYVTLVLRADNRGEGGIMALTALALKSVTQNSRFYYPVMLLGMIGAGLFFGDGVITPAITVLSSIEGIEVATPAFKPYVIPVTLAVLAGLYWVQHRGTGGIGKWFGPIVLVWFTTLAAMGVVNIVENTEILAALNPLYAFNFLRANGWFAFVALGAVVLALTGAEALYADMGHFGRKPVRLAWFSVVFPALALNYLGQGAMLLSNPAAAVNPFFYQLGEWSIYPLVALSTVAAVVASQATISGAFSVAQQAISLGFLPRMQILHTSSQEQGQVYIPLVNWLQFGAVVFAVVAFGSSTNLASAYGIAATATMLTTTLLTFFVVRYGWNYPWFVAIGATSFFLVFDVTLFASTSLKIVSGGWFTLVISAIMVTIMLTWRKGRELVFDNLKAHLIPLPEFLGSLFNTPPHRVPGTAVFFRTEGDGVPHAMLHNLLHNKVLHERVVFLTVISTDIPFVPTSERIKVEPLGNDCYQVDLLYGFVESRNVPADLELAAQYGLAFEPMETSYFIARQNIIATPGAGMAMWREGLYASMARNARDAADYFKLPSNRVIELGTQVEI
ncbi:potassium transporter Kup [Massilia psychrophila]|jgi:KUP system potassium uptake protein|uniref:Probable potassium transport system protein Kup n=1 Tax=Massilia psychrophila TaxID=1603353 RepID=A0A2G8T4B9_9BURK|nr:potassium transporter Kup [Massilia psychrophila]PIL40829.1 potassium transporter Kup [Massilia psychrophila]GGE73038.1 putative potassium transport system protein kup [Massilia psychrophila]